VWTIGCRYTDAWSSIHTARERARREEEETAAAAQKGSMLFAQLWRKQNLQDIQAQAEVGVDRQCRI
jgi:hypothetical protein